MGTGPGWAFASYLLVTLVLAFPTVRDLSGSLPSDLGDPGLNTWLLWYNTTGLPFTERWWNPPFFYPAANVLTYSEHLFGISIISTPVYWLTGNPVVAYNISFLLTFPLSGLTAYLLCFELTQRRDASWLAGLAFAFAPYRMDHLPHVQVLASYWMPLGLFALHRFYRGRGLRWLALFGVCTLMNGLTNGYYLLFYPALIVLWVLWFTPAQRWWRQVVVVAATGTLTVLLLAPSLLTYFRAHEELGLFRSPGEIRSFSADVSGLLSAPPTSAVWTFTDAVHRAEGQLFPGLTVVVLIAVALSRVRWRPSGPDPRALRAIRYSVGFASVVYAGVAVARAIIGPWQIELPGLRIGIYDVDKLLAQAVLFWFCSALLSPVGVRAYRRHSVFAFYCLGAFFLFVLALGPEPRFFGQPFMAHSAYKALTFLPGFDGLRVPARFWMLAAICVSVLAGLSFARLVPSASRRRRAVLAVLAVGILIDGWIIWPTATVPPRSAVLGRVDGGVLELPLGNLNHDTASMLRAIDHRQPLVNGFSGYRPPHYWALQHGLDRHREEMLDLVAGLGIRFVRIDRALDTEGRYERFVSDYPGARLVAEEDQEVLFELPAQSSPPTLESYGDAIDIAAVDSQTNHHLLERMRDGSLVSRWETGPQGPDQALQIDLAHAQPIGAVVTMLGPYLEDFPRALTIEVSADGIEWVQTWSGPTDGLAVVGALQRPREVPIVFPIGGRVAKHIRLRLMSGDPVYYWSIAELSVLAPAP